MNRSRVFAFVFAVGGLASSCSSNTVQPAEPTSPPISTSISTSISTPISTLIVPGSTGGRTAIVGSLLTVDSALPAPTIAGLPDDSGAPIGTAVSAGAVSSSTLISPARLTAPAVIGADGSIVAGVTLPPLSVTPGAVTPSAVTPIPVASVAPSAAPVPSVPSTGIALTLLTYDSFALSKGLLEAFTAATGIKVIVRNGGDAGDMVRGLVAARATPQADVVWGIDSTNLQSAFAGAVMYPYMARTRGDIPSAFTKLVPNNEATPIAYRDVCVNFDRKALVEQKIRVPTSFEDLAKPEFRGKFVVEDPVTSSTGLAFLLATISHFGPAGWQPYWTALKANGVKIVNSWTEAYYSNFSAGERGSPSGTLPGTFPLVVSFGSSPANAVALSTNPAAAEDPTGVVEATCFRIVEFASIVIGTRHQGEATQLIEFLSSVPVQEDVPLSMFIYSANSKARLPKSFTDFALRPAAPITLDPKQIEANKARWIAEWKSLGL